MSELKYDFYKRVFNGGVNNDISKNKTSELKNITENNSVITNEIKQTKIDFKFTSLNNNEIVPTKKVNIDSLLYKFIFDK
jgi:hypothetical protein